MPYFYNAKDRKPKEIVKGGRIRTFWGHNTLLSYVDIDPNVEVPRHTHTQEQSGIMLEGKMEMGIGDEVRVLSPGDIYIIPPGVEHYAKTTASKASVLDIFAPIRDDYKY